MGGYCHLERYPSLLIHFLFTLFKLILAPFIGAHGYMYGYRVRSAVGSVSQYSCALIVIIQAKVTSFEMNLLIYISYAESLSMQMPFEMTTMNLF